jgi:hypothetical protein
LKRRFVFGPVYQGAQAPAEGAGGRPAWLRRARLAAKRGAKILRSPSMVAIGMIAVFIIVLLGLNRWEFGRFD